jgi:RES domain-containing protein
MEVFRITKKEYASDLSGLGAKTFGGRWNSVGTSMVYTSSHASLAALELACHSGGVMGLKDFMLTCFWIEPKADREELSLDTLPKDWEQYPSSLDCAKIGDQWINSFSSLILKVPSAIIQEESNILVNPLHPQLQKFIRVKWVKPFTFDPRLFVQK